MCQANGLGLLFEQVDHRGAVQAKGLDTDALDQPRQPLGASKRAQLDMNVDGARKAAQVQF
ncbi:hypothetical protein D3C76_1592960 [compost metagenome]